MMSKFSFKSGNLFPKMPKIVRRFKKDEDGVTAIEFSILALPFFTLVFAIIETSVFFLAGQYLEASVDNVARKVRTGQLDNTLTEAQFRQEVCNEAAIMFDCSGLKLDMQVAATFDDLDDPPTPDADGNYDDSGYSFTAPGPIQIVQITATYEWPVITNLAAPLSTNAAGRWALLHVISVLRTEPYS